MGEVLVVGEAGARIAEVQDLELQLIAGGPHLRWQGGFGGTGQQVKLVGAVAVEGAAGAGFLRGAEAAEPFGGGAQAVAVVVEQGMLGRQAAGGGVELSGRVRGAEEGLQQGGLAVLVEVGARGEDRKSVV